MHVHIHPQLSEKKIAKTVHVLTTREADTVDTIVLASIEVVMENCVFTVV